MVVYYFISLVQVHYIYIDYSYNFLSMSILLSNQRSPFNRLRNEPKAFLVTIPEAHACRSFFSDSPLPPFFSQDGPPVPFFLTCISSLEFARGTFLKNKRIRTTGIWSLDPWNGNVLCWPLDHAAPPKSKNFDWKLWLTKSHLCARIKTLCLFVCLQHKVYFYIINTFGK